MPDHLLRNQPVKSLLQASFASFMLSREAMRCTPKTLEHYRYTVGGFVDWLTEASIKSPEDITPDHIVTRHAARAARFEHSRV